MIAGVIGGLGVTQWFFAPVGSLVWIVFGSACLVAAAGLFDDVRGRLRVSRVEHVASFRERELARIAREEPGVWPRARESTTLLSTAYEPLLRDSAFLLFTDDVFWRRPLYGAANLFWASGYTLYGVGATVFDRGARLRAGLLGAFWSLPELAFQNVRKGSYEWVSVEED
jgi:hypothetical protein